MSDNKYTVIQCFRSNQFEYIREAILKYHQQGYSGRFIVNTSMMNPDLMSLEFFPSFPSDPFSLAENVHTNINAYHRIYSEVKIKHTHQPIELITKQEFSMH